MTAATRKSSHTNSDAKWKLRGIAFLMVAVGVAGSILHDWLSIPWLSHLARDLAVALFVAGMLAASVDVFFKTELSKDVFNAAFSSSCQKN